MIASDAQGRLDMRKIVFGLLCLCLVACSDGNGNGEQDPCEGVLCSGFGECIVESGAAACQCDSGYHAEGLECVLDPVDCADVDILCVDDTPGAGQEYSTIQAAADVVEAGQTILVFDGNYAGFELSTGGTENERVIVRAEGDGAVIDADGPSGYGIWLRDVGHVTIQGLQIVGVSGRGLAHREATPEQPSRGLIIRNNIVQDAGREGMYLSEVADSLV